MVEKSMVMAMTTRSCRKIITPASSSEPDGLLDTTQARQNKKTVMPASTVNMVPARPRNLPQMNSLRETGLEKMMKTVRFSTSLRTRLAATKAATISPKRLIATRPKSLIMRSS